MSPIYRACLIAALAITGIPFDAAGAQSAVPTGLYYHEFTGAVDASEWSTWGALPGEGRYEFADIPAVGTYGSTFNPDGTFEFDRGIGQGVFREDGTATMDFDFGGGIRFHSEIRRAPYTDEYFPVFLESPVQGSSELAGVWSARVLEVNPLDGATMSESVADVGVVVDGSTVRVTLPDGTFYQSTWISDDRAAMRVVRPTTALPRYRTFPGSDTSLNQNVVGEVRVIDPNTMTLSAFRQTIAPLGEQVQSMNYITLSRVPAPGAGVPCGIALLLMTRRRRDS